MADVFDLIIIGSGPGGYVAAIRAAQLGMKVACVEKRATLGGTCLNVGCIPSKALLNATEKYHDIKENGAMYGIKAAGIKMDVKAMQKQKDDAVKSLTDGIAYLFKKNKVEWLKGAGKITAKDTVEVAKKSYKTKHILIASGSDSIDLPGVKTDEKNIVSSTGALEIGEVPKRLAVIGGGYIGLELGSVWARLGAKVTVVEYLDRITPGMDAEIAKQFMRILQKQGIEFKLGTKVTGASSKGKTVTLKMEPAKGGKEEELKVDKVLVAIGRKPHTASLGLDKVGVQLSERGQIKINGQYQTSVDNIYAIGDVVEGPMLAHKAEEEGVAVVENLAGMHTHINHDLIPGVVYTHPEVATVGKTEEQLKEAGIAYNVGKFPFSANSRAKTIGDTDGFVKILATKDEGRVLGAHIIGKDAGTLIAELVLAMEYGASAEDIYRTCHAHPTLNEAVKEAALAVDARPIHI